MVWRAFGVADNDNLTKSWYGKGIIGVAPTTLTYHTAFSTHVLCKTTVLNCFMGLTVGIYTYATS